MGRKWRAVKRWSKKQWKEWGEATLTKFLKRQIEKRARTKDTPRKSTGRGRRDTPKRWEDSDRYWGRDE